MPGVCKAEFRVSTHSRPKAAGIPTEDFSGWDPSFNTQPPEGGWKRYCVLHARTGPSFNTQPPEGGWARLGYSFLQPLVFQHTAARRRLAKTEPTPTEETNLFQHTAARRRLENTAAEKLANKLVSTHSRPKAAGPIAEAMRASAKVSTHSRPKAAGFLSNESQPFKIGFNTQPPEGGWSLS